MAAGPNILLVIVDDMGVHQLGCQGSTFYETPHIDRLAAGGVRWTESYSASPVCSPARAALYTGVHPARLHLTNYIPGTVPVNGRLITPDWSARLPLEVMTVADALKAQGYATGHFGKWHLAPDYHYRPGRPHDPESQGFEEVVVTRKPSSSADPEDDPHHIHRLTEDAIAFMNAPRDQPFLCVLAHNALHRPEFAPADRVKHFADKPGAERDCNRPVLAAMVSEVDRSLGRLMTAIEQRGALRDTLVVFTSDHGAFGRSAERKPLRGAKADLYEGGVRVPLIFHWTGQLAPGVRRTVAFGTDICPTLMEFAGMTLPADIDGRSLRPHLLDPEYAEPVHDVLCWHFPHYHHLGLAPCGAIRAGRWKLIEWFERTLAGADDGPPYELYDLEADPGETTNRAAEQSSLCAELAERLRRWRSEVGAQEMQPNPDFDPTRGTLAAPPPGDPGNPYSE